jgi:hypothetical protein
MRLWFVNRAAAATITASSQDANYPATFLGSPQRPFLPWKTLALGAQSAILDLLSAQSVDGLASIHTNYTAFTWEADDAITFNSGGGGAPQYQSPAITSGVLVGAVPRRNPWHRRYGHLHRPSPSVVRRYWRHSIPNQATTDGTSVYRNGGVWLGLSSSPPTSFRLNPKVRKVKPRVDTQPPHEGWRQRSIRGDTLVRITLERPARTNRAARAFNDELEAWLELEGQWDVGDIALVSLYDDDPSQVWVMRRIDEDEWTAGWPLAEGAIELEEVTGP